MGMRMPMKGKNMPRFAPLRMAAVTTLALCLSGCGGDKDAAIKEYVKVHGLSDLEAAALKTCMKSLTANKPILLASSGNVVMNSMPMDVCGCQVKTITAVFKDNQYMGFGTFARYMAKEKRKRAPPYGKKDLKSVMSASDVQSKLEGGLNTCVNAYKAANEKKSAKLFEPVPPPVPKT